MIKRIRYFKQADGSLGTKPIQTTHDLVTVRIAGLSWTVVSSTMDVLSSGSAKNDLQVKRQIKSALKDLGAIILDEVRTQKSNGVENV